MHTLPSLPDLTPDDRVWRVDWFGECAYPPSVRRYAQPSIAVMVSPLRCDLGDIEALLSPDATDHYHQRLVWLPVSTLPVVAVGDLWQFGQQVVRPSYQSEMFKGLSVTAENTTFVKAGLAIDEDFLLPLGSHPWHRSNTHSYCVAITLDADSRVLVPCVEIIHFYFGSSGNFLQRLFTGPLTAKALWVDKQFNSANRHLHLVLASRLSGMSATDIGRIAESRFAWRAAAGIFASCQRATAERHPAYPYTGFPFEGKSDLAASGIWLPFGLREHATFLVYRLRSCSYPFPFKSMSYEAADRQVRHGAPPAVGPESKLYSQARSRTDSASNIDPSARKSQRTVSFAVPERRFPDLIRKPIWREKLEAMPKSDVFLRGSDGSLERISYGEPNGVGDAAAVDAVEGQNVDEAKLPWFVETGLSVIAADPKYAGAEVRRRPVCRPGTTALAFSLPMVIDEHGEIDGIFLFTASDGGVRARRGCFVEVVGEIGPSRHLLIVEGRMRSIKPDIRIAARLDADDGVLIGWLTD